MTINRTQVRRYLKQFDFTSLFIEELLWDHIDVSPIPLEVNGNRYNLEAIAQKRGMIVYHCTPDGNGKLPNHPIRRKIDNEVTKYTREHLIIYSDATRQEQIWQWVRREKGKPLANREQRFSVNQSGDLLIQKLEVIAFSLDEEERLTLPEVTRRTRQTFDVEKVTKKFYERFKKEHGIFLKFILGISSAFDQEWYASLMLNRLMFIYFIQKKRFLDGDTNYLQNRLKRCQQDKGTDKFYSFYRYFLLKLFHDGLGNQQRPSDLEGLLGKIPYLNGGLFEVHQLEKTYTNIQIADEAFEKLFVFFDEYDWHLDDRPIKVGNEINPDVLGYIFEKYINQKQMGAYYTKEDITEYISKNCIIPFLFNAAEKANPGVFNSNDAIWQILSNNPNRYIYDAVQKGVDINVPDGIAAGINDVSKRGEWNKLASESFALPTETWREYITRRQRCLALREKLANGEINSINDLINYNLNIRQFAQDVIDNCENTKLLWVFYQVLEQVSVLDPTCGSGAFLFAALNILEPLYDACLERMQTFLDDGTASKNENDFRQLLDKVEHHHNRRYYILKSIIINNLYGVDIMEEATEICKLRLFLKLVAQVEPDKYEENLGIEPLPDIDFNIRAGNTLVGFANYKDVKKAVDGDGQMKLDLFSDMDRIDQKAQAVDETFQEFKILQTKESIDGSALAIKKEKLNKSLNELRLELDRYLTDEYVRGQSKKASQFKKWKESHQPFHWFVEFYGIIKNGGFDVIIGNPPYVELSKVSSSYTILGFVTESSGNLYAPIVERCLNILKPNKYLGVIIPISSFSTERAKVFQKLWLKQMKYSCLSHFGVRPSKIFEGADQRLTIVLGQKKSKEDDINYTYSSQYQRWNKNEREILLQRLEYALTDGSVFTKTGSNLARQISNKLQGQPLSYNFSLQGNHIFYWHRIPQYFIKAIDFEPYFFSDRDGNKRSDDYKIFKTKTIEEKDIIMAFLNSSLSYWYWMNCSEGYHFGKHEVLSMPANINKMDIACSQSLINIASLLMKDYKKNLIRKKRQQRNTNIEYDEFKPKVSKHLMDQIDCILAQHYGFTEEELDFIINYDIKYRMGRDTDEEEE